MSAVGAQIIRVSMSVTIAGAGTLRGFVNSSGSSAMFTAKRHASPRGLVQTPAQ